MNTRGNHRRIQIKTKGIGGRNESWWYLCHDASAGTTWIVHEWDNFNWGNHDTGEKKIELADADAWLLHAAAGHAATLGPACEAAVRAALPT